MQKNWQRNELLAALALYCQIPFGRINHKNPAIIALAKHIDRTPSAIVFKLGNLASFDPTLQKRGVYGLKHASAMDQKIWDEFAGDWSKLANAVPAEVAKVLGQRQLPKKSPAPPAQTEVIGLSTQRRGQDFFRNAVLAAYDGACCITGIAEPGLLRASHIIPWAKSKNDRLDPMNGLCLNCLHDAAFDRGLITLDEQLRVVLSHTLDEIKLELKQYAEKRAKFFVYSDVIVDVEFKAGSLQAYITIAGFIYLAIVNYGSFRSGIEFLYSDMKRLADSLISEGLFMTQTRYGLIRRTEARTGVIGSLKRLTDEMNLLEATIGEVSVENIARTIKKIKDDADELLLNLRSDEDAISLRGELELLSGQLPDRCPYPPDDRPDDIDIFLYRENLTEFRRAFPPRREEASDSP